ncbi:MAG TPA: RNA polymerase sigma factor [Bacteroidales bacterium]|nr:RNA polymerase sigma factor [Bacteroidales bacterium]HRZ48612.1 RNA polymerase sigma factor [Bacteroidales bacterium]
MSYANIPDEELMQRMQQGDRNAFSAVYDRYAGMLLRYFMKMLWQDREKAEDFVQDLFMKIIRNPESYDTSRPFKTWLFSVAMNMCKNEYRRVEVRKTAALEIGKTTGKSTTGDEPLERIDRTELTERLDRAVLELEPHHREAFLLRYEQNLSMKEMGESMQCSEGTAKSRLFYAVRKLSEKLKDYTNPDP